MGGQTHCCLEKGPSLQKKKTTLIEKMLKGLYECGQLIVGMEDYKFPPYIFMIGELQACS